MTHVYNAEHGFKDEFLEGLTAAYARYLRPIPGASGVMSVAAPSSGRVSVIIGGGSGHYPAFAGLVGPGLCDGAIVGDIFTSPSSEQAFRCIRALDGGAGVLLSFGNYSGDVMHFGLAVERARAQGIDARVVLVTDDVASAPRERSSDRRGIAGGFFVFRAAAAAAHQGHSIDDVEAIARRVNRATFSFGVAFGGCTFPGRSEPLFRVDPGRIELGLGIHGEPGIATVDWMPANELAGVMVEPLLLERPAGATRAQVLLNGLGDTKYEELFVLYRAVSQRLVREGIEIVNPEVGEYVTSLDMAGCSLTMCWLDDEIEGLLAAPASAPGFRMGRLTDPSPIPSSPVTSAPEGVATSGMPSPVTASTPTTQAARAAAAAFAAMADAMAGMEGELGRLDSVAGDGDHGAGMVRGMSAAAAAALVAGPSAAHVLNAAALAFSDAAGGASGALWGSGLLALGGALGRAGGSEEDGEEPLIDGPTVHRALVAALDAVTRLGGAVPGDKTMVDALTPFVSEFGASGDASVPRAWNAAVPAAARAAAATAELGARKGRAAVHGDRSKGTPDPGAVSLAAALAAAGEAIREACDPDLPSSDRPGDRGQRSS
jgi:dihydroxyacetone kinase